MAPVRDKRVIPFRRRSASRSPRRLLAVGLACAALLVAAPFVIDATNGLATASSGCRVISVVDGDTVKVRCPGQALRSGRLVGLDTPETFRPKCVSEFAKGVRATWRLRFALWTARAVSARPVGTDRYDRLLIKLRVDGGMEASVLAARLKALAADGAASVELITAPR